MFSKILNRPALAIVVSRLTMFAHSGVCAVVNASVPTPEV